jgi:hypothetical protein
MNMIKKTILSYKKVIFFTFVAVACAFGVYTAFITVDRYIVIVNATLGFTVLYMFVSEFMSIVRTADESAGITLEFPRDLRYILYGFFVTTVSLWASIQILHLIWYLKSFLPD